MRFPIWSSVLYLTGEEGENDGKGGVAHRQGATVILDQEFKDGAPAPEDPTSCVLVYPK